MDLIIVVDKMETVPDLLTVFSPSDSDSHLFYTCSRSATLYSSYFNQGRYLVSLRVLVLVPLSLVLDEVCSWTVVSTFYIRVQDFTSVTCHYP